MPRHQIPGLTLFDPNEPFDPRAGAIIKGVPDNIYHAGPGVSKSTLDAIRANPARYALERLFPRPEAEQYHVGKAYHCAVLEPQRFDDAYIRSEHDEFRSNDAKAWRAAQAAAGRAVLRTNGTDPWKPSEWDLVHRMAYEVRRHPLASVFLDPDDLWVELSGYWIDDAIDGQMRDAPTNLLCKCRPDGYNMAHEVIVDLKTTTDVTLTGFSRSAGEYRYHVQSCWYQWGWRVKLGLPCRGFILITQEKEPPYPVEVYVMGVEELRIAAIEMFGDLAAFRRYTDADDWPNTTGEIRAIEFQAWAKRGKIR